MRMRVTMALVGLLAAAPLQAQVSKPDSLLDHLIGNWVLTGPMHGQQVVHDVSFTWVLGGEYVEMHEVSRERTATGAPAYEAVVYLVHDPHTHEYAMMWMDNTDYNAFYPGGVGRGQAAADSISFLFTYTPTTSFHTTFVYDPRGWQLGMAHGQRCERRAEAVRARDARATRLTLTPCVSHPWP